MCGYNTPIALLDVLASAGEASARVAKSVLSPPAGLGGTIDVALTVMPSTCLPPIPDAGRQ